MRKAFDKTFIEADGLHQLLHTVSIYALRRGETSAQSAAIICPTSAGLKKHTVWKII